MIIEQKIYDFLTMQSDIPVYFEFPEKDAPDEFFLVEKTGSTFAEHISSSTIAIKTYAGRMFRASVLNDFLKHIMIYRLIQEDEIISIKLNSDYNFTDTSEKRYRYQAVFDVRHYQKGEKHGNKCAKRKRWKT